jgi:hypothetical protein
VVGGEVSRYQPSRRSVLALFGVSALLASGCTRSGTPKSPVKAPRIPSPDELAAGRAAVTARTLLDQELLLAASRPDLSAVIGVLAIAHRAHLAALGVPLSASASASIAPSASSAAAGRSGPSAAPASLPAPASPGGSSTSLSPAATGSLVAGTSASVPTPADAIKAEATAAQEALADVEITTQGTAGLLSRIAASRLVDADLLAAAAKMPAPGEPVIPARATSSPTSSPAGSATNSPDSSPTTSTTRDPASTAGLSHLLEAEHAAVFAYGLITARVPEARRQAARALWLAHLARRDELERELTAAGVTPPAALPAYGVGAVPATPAQITGLAARVEERMATVALAIVTTTSGYVRNQAALDLVRAARRAANWRGTSVPLPG